MEAYHPHEIHPKRKFKDYVIEFLMIFIAITGGFFMENFRESMIDRHKEKEFIVSLVKEIQIDTTSINSIIKGDENQLKGIDSLLDMMEVSHKDMNVSKFYKYVFLYLDTYTGANPSNTTITQLKNTGSLRLIKNKAISDRITDYYGIYESHSEQKIANIKMIEDLLALETEFMNFKLLRNTGGEGKITDYSKLDLFYNRSILFRAFIFSDIQWTKQLRTKSISLLKYLQTEYRIKKM